MTRRTKTVIAVALALLVLLIILGLLWWLWGRGPATPTNVNQPITEPERLPLEIIDKQPSPVKAPDVEASLKATASTFTERFGSFSNQGSFENLEDVRPLLTVKMRGTVDALIADQRSTAAADGPYYGVTTQALVVTITGYDESLGRADVTVITQRAESKGTTANPRVFYQKINLKLVKIGDAWKVDEAVWE